MYEVVFHTTQYALDANRPRMCRFVLTRCHDHALRVQFVHINDFYNGADRLDLKGVLHPRLVFGLFLHFSQKLQHIGNK